MITLLLKGILLIIFLFVGTFIISSIFSTEKPFVDRKPQEEEDDKN